MQQNSSAIPTNGMFRRSKTALVLAGGGILGAVYEIGALRAMNDMLVNHTVNDFDVYVGTSAGALVAAMLANGMTPKEMMQAISDNHPEVRGIQAEDIFQSNLNELVRRLPRLPRTMLRSARTFLAHFTEMPLADILWEFADLLPTGLYSGAALQAYLEEILQREGCVNRFDQLEKELYVVATDLDTGERAVFDASTSAPISKAVAASSAVPVLYKPVRIQGRDYIDGGIRGNASVDLAIEAGAELIVCVNPLAPLNVADLPGSGRHLADEGMRTVIRQTLRVLLHSGLRYHIKSLRHKYPDVDIILIEPRPDDQRMFAYDLMDYSGRLRAINHGFESVTVGLCEYFDHYQRALARHGIEITPRLVQEELEIIQASGYDPEVLRRVLAESHERRVQEERRRSLGGAMEQLERKLAQFQLTLDRLAHQ